ncbi:putative cyanobacterial phytochrome B [Hyaloscypha variabilis F]|uniref:Putative cyanobacterial phytochrome B n=1 Tax=Hyaloscypha variabilis (strain UAMH 11265 / GT02V1 / F) TaxID=1149755 RepID=A0A2J6RAK7_HYAVF|nr:putative cyanobacterial phytochrome B [Hyaloscypha variabilis F]
MQLFSDATSEKSNESQSASAHGTLNSASLGTQTPGEQDSISGLVTARFKHIVTTEGHAVITGRDGETLQRCEDEPIHIPGAVQSFGLLVALEEEEEGRMVVRVVSENSHRIIGYTPQDLFKLGSFTEILSEEQCDNLLDHVDFIRDEEADPATNGPEVFTISIRGPKSRRNQKLWCAMHINPSHPDIIICEFELDDDQMHPLVPPSEETPEPPEDTLHSNPTAIELAESTHASSKPLRVLRSARKRKGEAAAMEVFNIMSQVQEQLASAPNLDKFLKILVGVVKELTGFHRVMIYQFDAAFNGRVVTELVDPRATKDLYKGLNFPASDIPKQARDLYKINKVRLLYDRDLQTARLVCRSVEDLETPLDLSYSYLRAMSPIHIKYLANMAVRSSMSISINAFNELWGLIACHSYGSKGMRVSFPIRKMCRLVGDTASRNIERLSYASRLLARKLINTVPTEANPSGYIIASSDDLLKLFDADFGLLSIQGETKIMGKVDQSQEALAMLEYLRLRRITSVVTSQDIKGDFPDLRYPPGFEVIAGLLLVPLSVGGNDFIVFFRKGQIKEVKWAGNPYEKFVKEGTEGYLEPRKSFKTWSETVVGKCREWTEEQVETAAVLCLVYGKFIEVWRQKEAALQSSQLTRLLLANSAHEVRTPLNAIINYLEIALEGALDQETRDNLAKSHSASKSLIYVINDLLDLTKAEEGQELIQDALFDLPATLHEATDSFKGEAKRKGLEYEVIEHPGVPKLVHGDQRRVRQAVANITANAIQHTNSGWVRVEIWLQEILEDRVTIEIVVQDTGTGMSNEKLDALFRDLEQVTTDGDSFLDDSEEASRQMTQAKDNRTLGLGLAMVARIVRNMDGQLRLKSEEGKGSRFVIQLPFMLPVDDTGSGASSLRLSMEAVPAMATPPPPAAAEGEVTLVDKGSSSRSEGIVRRRSVEEIASLYSHRSGSSNRSNRSNKSTRSDVDRLIDAISTPLAVGEAETEEKSLQRSTSRGSWHSHKSAGSIGTPSTRTSLSNTRPGNLRRSKSYGAPEHLRSTIDGPPGSEFVTDNKTLLKAVRMPEDFVVSPTEETPRHTASRVLFDIPDGDCSPKSETPEKLDAEHLQILVAEDDPVNSRIIQKRLEKSGHQVHHTVNGEDCASAYGDKHVFFDVVLMDMQMPIVDGLTSTKMIRSYEKLHSGKLSARASGNGRVPIFAVSASLVERERQTYINAGFDGWILKPIDFKRLNVLLLGIVEDATRQSCLYKPGEWEKGGWFHRSQPSALEASTVPSEKSPVQSLPVKDTAQFDLESQHSSESGSITPKMDSHRKPLIHDERLDATRETENDSFFPTMEKGLADGATNDSTT